MINIYAAIIYIIIAGIVIWRIRAGFKRGAAGELANTFSMVVALIVGYKLYHVAVDFLAGHFGSVLAGVMYLAFLLFIYKIINILFKSLKLFTNLPIIKGVNKLLGAVLGIVEAFAIVYVGIKVLRTFL